jgi:predicted dehydrogenase/nucleoside-diphosphate-sugar epimerase
MNILITGASGFLGGHIIEQAVTAGHRVRAFVRKTSRIDALERLGVEIVRGDLKNEQSLHQAVADIDVVINAASSMDGVSQEVEAATVRGTRALLLAAEQSGVRRFIHISSIGIYAVRKLSRGETIAEDSPLEKEPRFLNEYVTSKISAESVALEFADHGKMKVIVLRSGIIYGPRGKWTLSRMGYAFGKNLYVIIGNGRNLLPVTYVENCANAALLAAENAAVDKGIFNIIDDEPLGQAEFLRRLKATANPALRIVKSPYALSYASAFVGERLGKLLGIPFPFRTPHMVMCGWRARYSNERAKGILGWRPSVNKEEALTRTMKYYASRNRVDRRANLAALERPIVVDPAIEVCIIGCGVIAEEHLKILKRIQGIRVTGICDSNPDAAAKLASNFSVPNAYSDVHRMLEAERPHAVHIVTPPQSHADLTQAAVQSGCHVLVEKPMAVTSREARAMAEIAAKHGRKLCIDHNHLYDPVVVRARQIVESGDMGDIVWVESYYGFDLGNNPDSRYLLPGGDKHWTFQLPGGLYQNLASHPLSLALDILGKPTKVQAHARYGRILPHADSDELRIILETPRATGMAVVSLAASPRSQFVDIYGTKMTLHVDVLNKWIIVQGSVKGLPKAASRALMHLRHGSAVIGGTLGSMIKVLRGRWSFCDGMEILIREFYRSLQNDCAPPVTAEDGISTMDIMDEVWQQIGMTGLDVGTGPSGQEGVRHRRSSVVQP